MSQPLRRVVAETSDEPRLLKAIAHPIRVEVLRLMGERVMSPNEVAKTMGERLSKISHHVKVLHELDCIELVETKQVRGATAHFYRAKEKAVISDSISSRLSEPMRQAITNTTVNNIVDRVTEATGAGTFDSRTDRHVTWAPLNLDEQGWDELIAAKARLLYEEWEIEARALNRMAESGEAPIRVISANLGFEAAPSD